ncbi:hypothetical protein BN946_scf184993.g9 [Trametes cinnabarina]|uniref:Ferritin-like domain-containing protein n=1 Tax=Pycnoporus cinnabarinus TaxID=5643 RepID=A0A060SUD3_PYCCI|nr:hypothetical protein BN946_scf184993.g9 [Trametes cinnabarina]
MFKKAILLSFVAASTVLGAPAPSQTDLIDIDVLNFALTLEHLENAFYTQGLAKYSPQDFERQGYPDWVRGRFEQISGHEAEHVKFLSSALGDTAVKPCEYNFQDKSPKSFIATSMVLETVGASAYLGGAKLLADNTDLLTAAGSILAVESRQASWITSAVMKLEPWNGPFDIPLTPSGAFSLAAPFIKSCPSSNPPLPVKTFPQLKISPTDPNEGAQVTVKYIKPSDAPDGDRYVAWLDGLQAVFTKVNKDGKAKVPDGLMGTVYAAVVKSKDMPDDNTMESGFAVVQFPFSSMADTN